ncbi:putative reverse transcriptase domain-containing protein [Tanacetum coccineum]
MEMMSPPMMTLMMMMLMTMRSLLRTRDEDEEEEEHLAPADSLDYYNYGLNTVPSAGDTEVFETDESAPTPRAPQIRAVGIRMRAADASPPLSFPHTAPRLYSPPEADMRLGRELVFTTPAPDTEMGEFSGWRCRKTARALLQRLTLGNQIHGLALRRGVLAHEDMSGQLEAPEGWRPEPQDAPALSLAESVSHCIIVAILHSIKFSWVTPTNRLFRKFCFFPLLAIIEIMAWLSIMGDPQLKRLRQKKMESVFTYQQNCAITNQVKFASCTLQGSALTWWNSYVRAVGQDVAYTMPWTALKRMITDKYCPRGEIKKLESEYWNLKVRGIAKVERYVGVFRHDSWPGLSHPSLRQMKRQLNFATEMLDKKMNTSQLKRQAENKRRFEEPSRNTQNQQQPFKRNNVARAYTAGPGDKKPYGGTKTIVAKCNYHHDGPCTLKCSNCRKTGHSARDCKVRPTANYNNNNNITRGPKGQIPPSFNLL